MDTVGILDLAVVVLAAVSVVCYSFAKHAFLAALWGIIFGLQIAKLMLHLSQR